MPKAGRPNAPMGSPNPQGPQGFNNPATQFQQNAPGYFQGVENKVNRSIANATKQFGPMGHPFPNRQHPQMPMSHGYPYGSQPGVGGGGRPKRRHVDEDPGVSMTPDGIPGGDTGPQAFGTYAPEIDPGQFKEGNPGRRGLAGTKSLMSGGLFEGGGMFGGMGGMGSMGMGGMGMMGGDMGMLMQLLPMLLGQYGGQGPIMGR